MAAIGSQRRPSGVALALFAVLCAAAIVVLSLPASKPVSGAAPLGGSQGTDASLMATPSVMTVTGRGAFSTMQVTVNQTANLVDQAISVTWKGAPPTYTASVGGFNGNFANDFVQMFECWGNDDGQVPTNPGPPPEQCEFGGQSNNLSAYPVSALTHAYDRAIAGPGWTCAATAPSGCLSFTQAQQLAMTTPTKAHYDSASGFVLDPFQAVDGTLVGASVNVNCCGGVPPWSSYDTNPYFNHITTNEQDFLRTYPDPTAQTSGTGQALFKIDTGLQAPGLGCGQSVEVHADGSTSIPKCWLVIVPRGTALEENPVGDLGGGNFPSVDTSPLAPTAWANRIAVPLQFEPIGTSCPQGANVRRILGGEMASLASAAWQPTLCQTAGDPPYSYAALSEDNARSQLLSGVSSGAGMSVVSQPIDPSTVDPSNPVTYAPLTLSGVVIGMNVQRSPQLGPGGQYFADEIPVAGSQVIHVQLTPRLVAKLLTQSYRNQFPGLSSANPPAGYSWVLKSALGLVEDPDFVQFNPEFAELRDPQALSDSTLMVEESNSDAAATVWKWILADPEAKAWLGGQPDPWGMSVNPYYSTNASLNPAGVAFGQPAIDNFPKSDPYLYQTTAVVGIPPNLVPARPLGVQDWAPYVNSMVAGANAARSANTGSKTTLNQSALLASNAWSADGPQTASQQLVMTITDSASAARFALQDASLSRAGDDGASRAFIAPDSAGLLAGESAMTPSAVPNVLIPNPSATTAGAYPLTMLAYAAVMPAGLDQTARHDYAAYINFAVGPGQVPGYGYGFLPPGYVSLPAALVSQATTAAATILNPPSPTTSTTTTPPTTALAHSSSAASTATSVRAQATTTPPPAVGGSAPATPRAATTPTAPPLTPVTTPKAATPAPTVSLAAPAVANPSHTAHSPASPVGAVRLVVPMLLLIGLSSGAGAFAFLRPRTR